MGSNWVGDQKRMMLAYDQKVGKPDIKQASLYLNMMLEELGETMCAANPKEAGMIRHHIGRLHDYARVSEYYDPVECLDGAVDVKVTTLGFGISMNYDLGRAWEFVFDSNWKKVDPVTGKVIKNAQGKVQKPDGWKSPTEQLAILVRQAGHAF